MVPTKSIENVIIDRSLVDLVLMVLYAWGIYAAVVRVAAIIPMVDTVMGCKVQNHCKRRRWKYIILVYRSARGTS